MTQATLSLYPESDTFSAYGVGPEVRILCADFTWQPAGKLAVGDSVIAFDEHITPGHRRRMRIAKVTSCNIIGRPSYRLTLTGGRQITVAEQFCAIAGDSSARWVRCRYAKVGHEIRDLGLPWEAGTSWEHGWLGGVFDGEGSLSSVNQGAWYISFPQNPGLVMDLTVRLLEQFGFEARWQTPTRDSKTGEPRKLQRIAITGIYDCFRFLGECRPVRLIGKSQPWIEARSGARSRGSRRNRRYNAVVEDVVYLGLQDIVALETDSHTVFAEGLYAGAGATPKPRVRQRAKKAVAVS